MLCHNNQAYMGLWPFCFTDLAFGHSAPSPTSSKFPPVSQALGGKKLPFSLSHCQSLEYSLGSASMMQAGRKWRPCSGCYCVWQASPNGQKYTNVRSPAPCTLVAVIVTAVMVGPAAADLLTSACPALAGVCEHQSPFYLYTVVWVEIILCWSKFCFLC